MNLLDVDFAKDSSIFVRFEQWYAYTQNFNQHICYRSDVNTTNFKLCFFNSFQYYRRFTELGRRTRMGMKKSMHSICATVYMDQSKSNEMV